MAKKLIQSRRLDVATVLKCNKFCVYGMRKCNQNLAMNIIINVKKSRISLI